MDKKLVKNFSANLREVMECLGVSQIEISRRTNLTQAAVSQFLSGKREPALPSIVALTKALGCTADRLIFGRKMV